MSFRIHRQPSTSSRLISTPVISPHPSSDGQPVTSTFRDVHVYDYTYRDLEYTPIVLENKRDWIEKLIPKMKNPLAVQGVSLILANMNQLNNFDTTNQKRAEDLLADIAYIVLTKDTDMLELLEEQLSDMYQLGQCAQGRVTRLWQLRTLF
jgi:hypothetical protein